MMSPDEAQIMLHAKQYRVAVGEVAGVKISLQSYQIGARFYCHVSNFDPGATIARAQADSAEEAKREALRKAAERLGGNKP